MRRKASSSPSRAAARSSCSSVRTLTAILMRLDVLRGENSSRPNMDAWARDYDLDARGSAQERECASVAARFDAVAAALPGTAPKPRLDSVRPRASRLELLRRLPRDAAGVARPDPVSPLLPQPRHRRP